jgi:hypothetical protein
VSSSAYGFHPSSRQETTSVRQRGRSEMSDTAIFVVGTLTFLLLAGGIFYTFLEVRRIEEETRAKRQYIQAVSSDGPANKK